MCSPILQRNLSYIGKGKVDSRRGSAPQLAASFSEKPSWSELLPYSLLFIHPGIILEAKKKSKMIGITLLILK